MDHAGVIIHAVQELGATTPPVVAVCTAATATRALISLRLIAGRPPRAATARPSVSTCAPASRVDSSSTDATSGARQRQRPAVVPKATAA